MVDRNNKNYKKIVESKRFYLDHIYLELVASSYNLDSNLGIQRVSILLHLYTEKNIILPIASKPKPFSKTTFQPILIKLKTFSKQQSVKRMQSCAQSVYISE